MFEKMRSKKTTFSLKKTWKSIIWQIYALEKVVEKNRKNFLTFKMILKSFLNDFEIKKNFF